MTAGMIQQYGEYSDKRRGTAMERAGTSKASVIRDQKRLLGCADTRHPLRPISKVAFIICNPAMSNPKKHFIHLQHAVIQRNTEVTCTRHRAQTSICLNQPSFLPDEARRRSSELKVSQVGQWARAGQAARDGVGSRSKQVNQDQDFVPHSTLTHCITLNKTLHHIFSRWKWYNVPIPPCCACGAIGARKALSGHWLKGTR